MQTTTMIAAVLAPVVGGGIWWALHRPGKWVSDFAWKRLPEGRLRRILLRKVS